MIGKDVLHYRIIDHIGKGGMGEVFFAYDTSLDRKVALKFLPDIFSSDPERLARFKREARLSAALNHPNIAAIYGFETADNRSFLVLELVEGETLAQRIAKGALPVDEALEICRQIAEGLEAAHEKGIIHRDLKPANIKITPQGQAKVLDFGLAKMFQPETPAPDASNSPTLTDQMTCPGVIQGTAAYMAPEQAKGKVVDKRADIWAFGCVLYECLTGARPFQGGTIAEVMAAILKSEPEWSLLPANTPIMVRSLLRRCLQKDPNRRLHDIADARIEMQEGSGLPSETLPVPPQPRQFKIKGRIWAYLAGSLILACGLAYLVWVRLPPSGISWEQPVMIAQVAGMPRMPSLAPDGGMIAFVNEANGTDQIFIMHGAQGSARQLTFGNLPARRPRWSPKNDQILFSLGEQAQGSPSFGNESIWSVPPLGGVPHLVIEGGRNPNWSRDGTRIVFERRDEVWTAGSDGKNQSRVEGVPHATYLLAHRTPAFSPDGTVIVFFHTESGPSGDLWIIPVQGGVPKRLTLDVFEGGYPVWTPDGRSILFISQRRGIADLWRISSSGGKPELMFGATGENDDPDISADGRKLAFSSTRNQYVLTILDPAAGRTRELLERRLAITHPMFSPQGDKVAFFAAEGEGGFSQISTIDADGINLNRVTRDNSERNNFPHWSGDGVSLYYYRSLPDLSFRRIPITGGVSKEIVRGWSWEANYGARVDASGEWIVYTETKAGAPFRTLIRNIKTGNEHALARALDDPRWSTDAKNVLGTDLGDATPPQGDISICPADGKECRKLARGYLAVWSFDNRSIYYLRTAGYSDRAELRSISVSGGNERPVAELRPMRSIGHYYDVSPRGEIVYVQFKPGKRDLWLAELK